MRSRMGMSGLAFAFLWHSSGIAQQTIPAAAGQSLWPISVESLRAAAAAFRPALDWSSARIAFPPGLRTRSEHAMLRATEAREGREARHIALRLECRVVRDCAPFWADVLLPESLSRPVGANATGKLPMPSGFASDHTSPPIVRPGRSVALICRQAGLEISMRVMPLQRASLGETVKVLDPQTQRKFLARVEGPDLVRSDLREAK